MQRDVDRLLRAASADVRDFPPARFVTYREAIADACGIDSRDASEADIAPCLPLAALSPRMRKPGIATTGWTF